MELPGILPVVPFLSGVSPSKYAELRAGLAVALNVEAVVEGTFNLTATDPRFRFLFCLSPRRLAGILVVPGHGIALET